MANTHRNGQKSQIAFVTYQIVGQDQKHLRSICLN